MKANKITFDRIKKSPYKRKQNWKDKATLIKGRGNNLQNVYEPGDYFEVYD